MAIRAKVKKPFPYARDGIRSRQMQVGEVDDFPDDVFAGLEAAGQIEKTSEPLSAPAPEPDWSALGDNELVGLIRARTGATVNAGSMSHDELVARARQAFAEGASQAAAANADAESGEPKAKGHAGGARAKS